MPYATLDDLIARAGEREIMDVTDRDRDGTPDPAVVSEALTHADNIINGYVRARYTLPFAVVPDLLRTWAVAIARHKLHHNKPPIYVVAEYDDAKSALRDVASGKLALPIETGEVPETVTGKVMGSDPGTSTAREILRGWL